MQKSEYRSYILVDFRTAPSEVVDLFLHHGYDLDYLYAALSAMCQIQLFRRESLIILDNVQHCPKARGLTKYMVEDGRYDVIKTGCLVSIRENVRDIVIPSEERKLELCPLDFEEYLWATGNEVLFPFIRKSFEERKRLTEMIHSVAMKAFRQYLLVGGMPEAVMGYLESHSFQACDAVKKDILELYRKDASSYAERSVSKALAVFNRLPEVLSLKEKRFPITLLGKNARARDYYYAFDWLGEAGIANIITAAEEPGDWLLQSLDDWRSKCYMMDTGLLVTHAANSKVELEDDPYRALLVGREGINNGIFTENYAAQALRSSGHKIFWFSHAKSAKSRKDEIEIDFLIKRGGKIVPIEVKCGKTIHHASMDKLVKKYGKYLGEPVILTLRDLEKRNGILYLPLYMASLI